jgi:hypothetical protein
MDEEEEYIQQSLVQEEEEGRNTSVISGEFTRWHIVLLAIVLSKPFRCSPCLVVTSRNLLGFEEKDAGDRGTVYASQGGSNGDVGFGISETSQAGAGRRLGSPSDGMG